MAKLKKVRRLRSVYIGNLCFICGEDEGGGGVFLILLETMLVRCKKGSGGWGLNLCFIVVVLVIVWGIIFGDMCERGSFFIVSV